MRTIRKWVRITPQGAWINGVRVRLDESQDPLPVALYRQRIGGYPKFFKMDPMCRLGFVASELLLEGEEERFTPREDRAVVLFSNSGSFASDSHYEETIANPEEYYPSPAVFVYTLANIVTGEIAIRNKFFGETICYLTDRNDMRLMVETVDEALEDPVTRSVVTGWVESPSAECFEAVLFLVEKTDGEAAGQAVEWRTDEVEKIMNNKELTSII